MPWTSSSVGELQGLGHLREVGRLGRVLCVSLLLFIAFLKGPVGTI